MQPLEHPITLSEEDDALPYPPSWINRLFDRIDRLPGPYWASYLVLGLGMMALETALKWRDGLYPVGTLSPFHLVFAGSIALGLWGLDYATRQTREAVHALRPMLTLNPAQQAQIEYRLRYLPARATLWTGLAFGLGSGSLFIWLVCQIPQARLLQGSGLGIAVDGLLCLMYATWQGAFVYATYHLQTQIGLVYARYLNVDLLLPQPLYALSAVSTRAALVTLFVVYLWAFTLPPGPYHTLILGIFLVFGLMGIAILILPLRGAQRRLAAEKRKLQAQVGERIKAAIAQLYQKADSGDLKDIDGLNKLMASLELTRQIIDRASTWPWHPDTPRLLITAMLLPIVVWLLQRFLGKIL